MNYNNLNLKKSTLFDLTKDTNILVGEFGITETPEEYSKAISIETRIKDFLDFAELTKNNKLKEVVYSQFKEELLIFGY